MTADDLTLTEAAAVLGLKRWSVWALVKKKLLPATAIRVAGHAKPLWFIKRADVDAYAERRGDQLGQAGRTRTRPREG